MKTKHTAGPWSWLGATVGRESESAFDCVAWVDLSRLSSHTEEWQANARLIAAAPEMLEALRKSAEAAEWAETAAEKLPCSSEFCAGTCHRCAAMRKAGEAARITREAISKAVPHD